MDIVHGCQLRCIGCPNSGLRPKIRFMSPEDFGACLGNVDVAEVKVLRLFNFGEPLLHPDVPAILSLIPCQRFHVRNVELSTNAQAHDFAMLAEVFKTGVLDTLVVSCDGDGTPAEYERLRPPARWEKLLEFLARSKELRNAHGPRTRLITRTICETPEGQGRWMELLAPWGYSPQFRGWLSLPGSRENPSGRAPAAGNEVCAYLQRRTLYVDFDGAVVACCVHPRAGVFGNLKEARYSEIVRGTARTAMLRQLKHCRQDMPICGKCEIGPRRHGMAKVLRRIARSLSVS